MTKHLFFQHPNGMTAQEIAALTGAVVPAGAPGERRITGIAPLDRAGPFDLSFMQNVKYEAQFASTLAGICLVTKRFAAAAPANVAILVAPAPYRAFVAAAQKLYPAALRPSSLFEEIGRASCRE